MQKLIFRNDAIMHKAIAQIDHSISDLQCITSSTKRGLLKSSIKFLRTDLGYKFFHQDIQSEKIINIDSLIQAMRNAHKILLDLRA